MEDAKSPAHEGDNKVWSAIRRYRMALLAAGVGGVASSMGLAATLLAMQPAYITSTIQIWQHLLGPSSGPGGSTEKAYKVHVQAPAEMYLGDDLPVTVSLSVDSDSYKYDPAVRIHVMLEGPSFKTTPSGGIDLELKDGRSALFIVTASATGSKSLRVVDQFWITDEPDIREKPFPSSGSKEFAPRGPNAADARIVNIAVLDPPMFFMFNRSVMKDVQIFAAIVGVPSLLTLLLSGWRERRKERQQRHRQESTRRVVAPPTVKPRRTDR